MTTRRRKRRNQGLRRVDVRVNIGFGAEPDSGSSALDMFAMVESLSPEGEALWNEAMARIERERRDPDLTQAPVS
jgi:hypothetical protein